jgi:hypothetical protein
MSEDAGAPSIGRPLAARLMKLRIDEVSGVDSPANEADGWGVLKSKKPMTTAEEEIFRKLAGEDGAAVSTSVSATAVSIGAAPDPADALARKVADGDLESAQALRVLIPDEDEFVQKVRDAIPAPPAAAPEIDIQKAVDEATVEYTDLIEKLLDRNEKLEEANTRLARKSLDGQESPGDDVSTGRKDALFKVFR